MNFKDELLEHIGNKLVDHINLNIGGQIYNLETGFTKSKWNTFLINLDFEYQNSAVTQSTSGDIFYKDDTTSSRVSLDLDQSEWWHYNI